MAMGIEQLMSVLYLLIAWVTVASVMLILARRDVALGLKKWWLLKRKKQPLMIRYYGADLNVHERVIGIRGKGDSISLDDRKGLFGSKGAGSTFFLDEKAIRRRDDGVNEINYSYLSVMPIDPDAKDVDRSGDGFVKPFVKVEEQDNVNVPIELDRKAQFTDPRRLNRLLEYITLAAKTSALAESEDVLKYAKLAFFAALGAAGVALFVWYTIDGDVVPTLQQIHSLVSNIGSTVLNV